MKTATLDSLGLTRHVLDITIRLALIALLLVWALRTVGAFANPLLWGAILAVALYPLFQKLVALAGGRTKLVGVLFILLSIAVVIGPTVWLVNNSIDGATELAHTLKKGEFHIPPPDEKVKEWPLVGEKTYTAWDNASKDPKGMAKKFAPQLKQLGEYLVGQIASGGKFVLGLTFSLILAGVFMINGESCADFLRKLGRRIAGEGGTELVKLTTGTVRGVALGVVGTAFIQAMAAALGLALMGVPIPALWAGLVLMCGVAQLPPLLVLGPIAAYCYSTTGGLPATLFLIWSLVINFGDGVLKPLLMGRGVDIPMLVILVGAIGGMVTFGIMGLFVGAVVVALAYKLFTAWLNFEEKKIEIEEETQAPQES